MVRRQVQFTERQAKKLKSAAVRYQVSFSEMVRRLVDRGLQEGPSSPEEERRALFDRAQTVVGKYASGKSDVAERHDDYLAEAYLAQHRS